MGKEKTKDRNMDHYAKPVKKRTGGKYFTSKQTTEDYEMEAVYGDKEGVIIPVPIQAVRFSGRPTKYKPIYCKKVIDYFVNATPLIKITDDPGGKGGTQTKIETLYIPTVRGFAASIGVHLDTLYEWKKVHEEFSEAFSRANAIQDALVEQLALAGRIGKGIGELYFINRLNYRDSRHIDVTSDGKEIKPPITALQLNVNANQPTIPETTQD